MARRNARAQKDAPCTKTIPFPDSSGYIFEIQKKTKGKTAHLLSHPTPCDWPVQPDMPADELER